MVAVRVMSWNIQKFGRTKCFDVNDEPTGFVSFVAQVIRNNNVHIVGLMEVFQADFVGSLLVSELSQQYAQGQSPWSYIASSVQDCNGAAEAYLYIYNTAVVTVDETAIPGPFFSLTFADQNAFANFGRIYGFDGDAAADDAMNKWLTETPCVKPQAAGRPFRTIASVCEELWQGKGALENLHDFKPPLPPAHGDYDTFRADVAKAIYYLDMTLFTTASDRTPFIGCFLVGGQPLVTALFHAPGTGDGDRYSASNISGQSRFLIDQPNVLVMGDFNIKANEDAMTDVFVYGYDVQSAAWQKSANQRASPFQFVKTANGPGGGAGLNAPEALNTPTSLTSVYPIGDPDSTTVRSSAYDRFFYKGDTLAIGEVGVVDLIEFLCVGRHADDANMDAARTAVQALKRYKTYINADWREWFTDKISAWQEEKASHQKTLNRAKDALSKDIKEYNDAIQYKTEEEIHIIKQSPVYRRIYYNKAIVDRCQEIIDGCEEAIASYAQLHDNIDGGNYAAVPNTGTSWIVTRGLISDHLPILATLDSP